MASYHTLDLTLIAAHNLKKVHSFTPVYAVVSLTDDPHTLQRTPSDCYGGRNPTWNSTIILKVPADTITISHSFIHILLRKEHVCGDRDVAEVFIPLRDLYAASTIPQFLSYQVRKTFSSRPRGVIDISYKLREPVMDAPLLAYTQKPMDYPVVGYPVESSSRTGYRYGYCSHAVHPRRKKHGLGLGILSGLLLGAWIF